MDPTKLEDALKHLDKSEFATEHWVKLLRDNKAMTIESLEANLGRKLPEVRAQLGLPMPDMRRTKYVTLTRDNAVVILQSLISTKSLETCTDATKARKEVAQELERVFPGILSHASAERLLT